MFGNIGMWELLLILFVVLLLFGAKRLPELAGSLGKGIREFKSSLKEVDDEIKEIGSGDTGEPSRSEPQREKEHQV